MRRRTPAATRRLATALLGALAIGTVAQAGASSYFGPLPIPQRRFASFADCHRYLLAQYAQDRSSHGDVPATGSAIGTRHFIDSSGVTAPAAQRAEYVAHLSEQVRSIDRARAVLVSQVAFVDSTLRRDGASLTGNRAEGLSEPDEQPLPVSPPAQNAAKHTQK